MNTTTSKKLLLGFVISLSILFGITIGWKSEIGIALSLIALFGVVALVWPRTVIFASIATMVVGQLVRLTIFGQDGALLLNDLLLPPLIIAWLIRGIFKKTLQIPRSSIWLPLLGVLVTMLVSGLLNYSSHDHQDWLAGMFYFVRWIEYLAIFFIVYDLTRTEHQQRQTLAWLIGSGLVVALLGFIQLLVFPDFTSMVPNGWDPHVGRLLSTWFDPNFLGGFLAMLAAIALAVALTRPSKNIGWWTIFGILAIAEVLTYSRSGYLGFVAAIFVVTAVRSRAILFLGALTIFTTVLFVPRVQERVLGIRSVDQTAQFRIVSWKNAMDIVSDHPWFGVGYNHYKYAQLQRGFITDTNEHSASGSDSSLLTIIVTTGVVGAIWYLWLYAAICWEFFLVARQKNLQPIIRAIGLGSLGAMIGLFVHSQFVNGWFYPHIMETVWILLALHHRMRNV